jgi:hypothetical protein
MTAAPTPYNHAHNSIRTLCTSCVARFTFRSPCSKRKKETFLPYEEEVESGIKFRKSALQTLCCQSLCAAGMEYYGLWVPYRDTTCAHLFVVHLTTLSRLLGGHPTNRGSIADSGNKCDFPPSAILTLETTLPKRKLYQGAASPVTCTGQSLEHVF